LTDTRRQELEDDGAGAAAAMRETAAPSVPGDEHRTPSLDVLLGPEERVAGRPFTDLAEIDSDTWIMGDMLRQERALVRAWLQESVTGPGVSELVEAGWRHLVAVPDRARLVTANDVTAVGFFGQLRPNVDHAVLFEHERRVTETFDQFAEIGLLSYFDLGPEHGRFGNLILFWTPEVPASWHANAAHIAATEAAPCHYQSIRLHKGRIPGPFLGDGALRLERTTYLDYTGAQVWRAVRVYGEE
jgi:hypothetical protein